MLKVFGACRLVILRMRRQAAHEQGYSGPIPSKGDRIEVLQPRTGIRMRGTVFYSDQLQILVKWDKGTSGSLRTGVDRFRILD